MVLANAYGGSLKAWLTYPARTKPINTLSDILKSGLPWGLVLYGEEEETVMAQSEEPVMKAIWTRKNIVEFSSIPQLNGIYRGEEVLIDYKSGVEQTIFVRYSTPAGNPLVHMSQTPVVRTNMAAWGFHKYNPWKSRFDKIMRLMIEAGLPKFYQKRTMARMKEIYLASDEEKPDFKERPQISSLSIDDLQGPFYLTFLGFVCGTVLFIIEKVTKGQQELRVSKNRNYPIIM